MGTIWTSRVPFTYEIGYETNHVGNPDFTRRVAAGRPGLLHTGHDVPLNSATGNTIQFTPHEMRYLSPEDIPARIEELRAFVQELHEAGARKVMPYIITMVFIGNPITRTGFWQLYDRWEEFAPLGLGPKPETDPIHWLQSGPRPMPHPGVFAYETTVCHPAVQRFLKVCVDLVAQCGYDGTFLDVNTMVGFSEADRRWFSEYLWQRYTPEELVSLFAFASPDDVLLGHPGDGLLWVETQRFRSWAFGQLFAMLRDAGRAHVPDFFVLPNNWPMCTVDAFYRRRLVGYDLTYLHNGCEMFMFEEMQQAGRFGADRICDHVFQYRFALAHGMQGVVLLYYANDADAIALANAEAAAGGGGAFVQCGFAQADAMRFWGEWFDRHAERCANLESVHDVALVFFVEQMYWENKQHIDAAFRVRQALSNNHILFDVLVEPYLTAESLASFDVVIVPEVHYLSDAAIKLLTDYVEGGGRLIVIGKSGAYDERGNSRPHPLREQIAPFGQAVLWVDNVNALVPSCGPELFDLTEEEFNSIETVLALPDRVSSAEEAQEAVRVPLVSALERLVGRSLPVLAEETPYTLRVSAFRDPRNDRRIVHLVNYDLPVHERGKSGPPCPARNVRLRMPAKSARWWTPEGIDGAPLTVKGGEVLVPEVQIYAMVELRGE